MIIGIREEDKSIWERRVPLVPEDVKKLVEKGYRVIVEPSSHRIFKDEEFKQAGAEISKDLSPSKVILGVKEIPPEKIEKKTYVFFSHTIKGQPYNMPMLKKILDTGATLIDYEKIVDDKGRRLIFFGHFAGYAGMIDALYLLGKKLELMGYRTPLSEIKRAYEYDSLEEAKKSIREIGEKLKNTELPEEILPLVFGFAGYGNVSRGAQEILEELSPVEISPDDLFLGKKEALIYKVVFKEEHMVEPLEGDFELLDYYKNPHKYKGVFEKYLPHLTLLVNAIYWEDKYPRLFTKEQAKSLYKEGKKKLIVTADISCDVKGAIEFTERCGEPDNGIITYLPEEDSIKEGILKDGITNLIVDILPSELPREASYSFSRVLMGFIEDIANADYSVEYEELSLPPEIKRAVIAHKGYLTPDYEYIYEYIKKVVK